MSALRKYEVTETEVRATEPVEKNGRWIAVPITAEERAVTEVRRESTVKNIALFLAAPLVALAYVIAMPFVAMGMMLWLGAKILAKKVPATKAVALAITAPFIGLAAVIVAPFAGLGALTWIGMKALANR